MNQYPHIPVLLNEFLDAFSGVKLARYIDGTLGAGGHGEAILAAHPELNTFIGIDQDKDALEIAKERLGTAFPDRELSFILGNFSELQNHIKQLKCPLGFDGILVDLGVSSMQLDRQERGFSFMRDGPLDMRMNQRGGITAADIVNTWEERALNDLFFQYGEEKQSRKAAHAICLERAIQPFETTLQLSSCIEKNIKRIKYDIHPATKIFQALRIAVNGELDRLEAFLPQAIEALNPGGRLAVITFHSLEDRIVKHRFAYYASDKESTSGIGGMFLEKKPVVKIITRKPIEAGEEEVRRNPRSRSAKLRVIEKL